VSRDFIFAGDAGEHFNGVRELERFREEQRNGAPEEHQSEAADPVTALLLYLADGYETGSLAARAVAFLLLVRPDLVRGETYKQIGDRLGVGPSSVLRAVRIFRETVPIQGMTDRLQTSKSRLLSIGQIRARRRQLWLEHVERIAEARKLVRREMVRGSVMHDLRREVDQQARRQVQAAALGVDSILAQIAQKQAELDANMVRRCAVPPETQETAGMSAFERVRKEIRDRQAATKGGA